MNFLVPIFAETSNVLGTAAGVIAQSNDATKRVTYEWTRLATFTEWWQKPLLVLICVAIAAFVLWMYRRDSVELKPGVGWLLLAMRVAAFGGLLLFYLGLEKLTEKKVTHNSRAILLIDTSLSMSRRDTGQPSSAAQASRIEQVIAELADTDLLKDLRKTHDVSVFRFDQDTQKIQSFGKFADPAAEKRPAREELAAAQEEIQPYKYTAFIGGAIFLLAGMGLIAQRITQGQFTAPWIWGGIVGLSLLACLLSLGYLNISYPRANLWALLGLIDEPVDADGKPEEAEKKPVLVPEKPVDWALELQPHGTETRLGQALQQLLNEERNTPLAGIVVYTDGGQNSGIDPKAAMDLAKETNIPIFTVGLGSDQRPINVRVTRFEAPPRVYPGDGFKVTGFLQGEGLAGRNVSVELHSRPTGKADVPPDANWTPAGASQLIVLGKDGEEKSVTFDLPGTSETSRKTYRLRVVPPPGDSNPNDNEQQAEIEVVARKNKVLLVAGGPTREYQFLRTQLKREKDTVVDVLLQSGGDGISQEANQILSDFPRTKDELFAYDTIVVFDPNWANFDQTQIDLLEKWVGEQAGGLIIIAGPIYTDQLAHNEKLKKIKDLYPVEFQRRFAVLDSGQFGAAEAKPIEFTRAGQEAEYLWLDDLQAKSQQIWGEFPGVYGFYEVRGPKPGATVLGYRLNADSISKQQYIYFAEQFYGAGRVFYEGSGEMWRLRPLDPGYFDQFYTKVIRHVSQGRLLRGSSRGMLLVERDRYLLGSPVPIRAQLLNAQLEPLDLEQVTVQVALPKQNKQDSEKVLPLTLTPDPARKGAYSGQFTAQLEGTYTLTLEIPQSGNELLTKRIQATVSDRELENPQLNSKLLKEIADTTGGTFYPGVAATQSGEAARLLAKIPDRTERGFLPGQVDQDWQQAYMTWIMVGICGALCLEWMIRRLCKLA